MRQRPLSPGQQMARQQATQAINIALSVREQIRQGYLFGAVVLLRPLAERATGLTPLDDPIRVLVSPRVRGELPPRSEENAMLSSVWEG